MTEVNQIDPIDLNESLSEALAEANGKLPEVIPGDPRRAARLAAVQAGMVEVQTFITERDKYRQLYEEERYKNAELGIAIEQAREAERIHVKKVVDDAVIEGKKAEVEIEALGREITDLRERLSYRDKELQDSRAEGERLRSGLDLIRAAIGKIID